MASDFADNLLDGNAFNHPLGLGFGRTLKDMRFMGKVLLVYGFLCCLTLVGAALGVPLIVVARRFLKAIDHFEVYRAAPDSPGLKAGFAELGRSFRLMKILTIVSLVVSVLYVFFVLLLGGCSLLNGLQQFG